MQLPTSGQFPVVWSKFLPTAPHKTTTGILIDFSHGVHKAQINDTQEYDYTQKKKNDIGNFQFGRVPSSRQGSTHFTSIRKLSTSAFDYASHAPQLRSYNYYVEAWLPKLVKQVCTQVSCRDVAGWLEGGSNVVKEVIILMKFGMYNKCRLKKPANLSTSPYPYGEKPPILYCTW